MQILRRLYDSQREVARANPGTAKELIGNLPLSPDTTVEDLAAWYAVATALLNLDEMITKR